MTKNEMHTPMADLNAEVAALVERFGRGRILLATLKAYLRGAPRPPNADHLSDHLRRDMGLPENLADLAKTRWDTRI